MLRSAGKSLIGLTRLFCPVHGRLEVLSFFSLLLLLLLLGLCCLTLEHATTILNFVALDIIVMLLVIARIVGRLLHSEYPGYPTSQKLPPDRRTRIGSLTHAIAGNP